MVCLCELLHLPVTLVGLLCWSACKNCYDCYFGWLAALLLFTHTFPSLLRQRSLRYHCSLAVDTHFSITVCQPFPRYHCSWAFDTHSSITDAPTLPALLLFLNTFALLLLHSVCVKVLLFSFVFYRLQTDCGLKVLAIITFILSF